MKPADSPSPPYLVRDPKAAAFLIDRNNSELLHQFWGRTSTVAQLAKTLKLRRNAALYRVRRMVELGLLEVAQVQKRGGRDILHYRLVADQFYVPFSVTHFETLQNFLRASLQPLFDYQIELEAKLMLRRAPDSVWGMHLRTDAHGNLGLDPAPLEGGEIKPLRGVPTVGSRSWLTINIAPGRVREVLETFHTLNHQLHAECDDNDELYLVHMTLLPLGSTTNAFEHRSE